MSQSVHIIFQDIELPHVRGEIRFSNDVPILTIRHYLELDSLITDKIKALYNIPDDIYLRVIDISENSITYEAYKHIKEHNQFGDEVNRGEPVKLEFRGGGGRKRTRKMRKTRRRHRKN
jgi:hypothetical protein